MIFLIPSFLSMKLTAMIGWRHLANHMLRQVIATLTLPIWSTGARSRVLNVSSDCLISRLRNSLAFTRKIELSFLLTFLYLHFTFFLILRHFFNQCISSSIRTVQIVPVKVKTKKKKKKGKFALGELLDFSFEDNH